MTGIPHQNCLTIETKLIFKKLDQTIALPKGLTNISFHGFTFLKNIHINKLQKHMKTHMHHKAIIEINIHKILYTKIYPFKLTKTPLNK